MDGIGSEAPVDLSGSQIPVEPTVIGPPSAPNRGGYMYTSSTSVILSWVVPENDGGAPITTYLVALTPDTEPTTYHVIQSPANYYELNTLVHGINVQATVTASNDDGTTYGPECVFPTIVPILPPQSPPTSAEAIPESSGVASISWQPPDTTPEGNPYYLVMSKSSNPNDPSIVLGTADMTQTSGTLSELNWQSEYFFTVEIVNAVGSAATVTNTIVFSPPPPREEPVVEPVAESAPT